MFGGNNSSERMNDLWRFDLTINKWSPVEVVSENLPKVFFNLYFKIRCGHSMVLY